LIEFLSAPRRQEEFLRLTGDLPARRSAWSDALRADPVLGAFWTQMQRVRPAPQVAEWERIAQAVARHAEAAIRGMESPEQALANLDAEVDALLEKRRWLLAHGRLPAAAEGEAR
jgi:multiple sugar transport system substrate-binding protein